MSQSSITSFFRISGGGATAHEWVSAITPGGAVTMSQPAFSDIAGTATSGQLPADVAYLDVTQTWTKAQTISVAVGPQFIVESVSGAAQITLNCATGNNAGFLLEDAGSQEWFFGTTNKNFELYDEANSQLRMFVYQAGALFLYTGATTGQIIAQGVGSQSANIFEVQDSGGGHLFVVEAGGNVGIGTASPGVPLEVAGNIHANKSGQGIVQIIPNIGENFIESGTYNAGAAQDFGIAGPSGGVLSNIYLNATSVICGDSGVNSQLQVADGDGTFTAGYQGSGYLGIGAFGYQLISTGVSDTSTYVQARGSLYIQTNESVSTVNAAIFNTAGNVGIGTVSPGSRLDVQYVAAGPQMRLIGSAIGGNDCSMDFMAVNAVAVTYLRFGLNATNGAAGSETGGFFFETINAGTLSTKMELKPDGGLTIGTPTGGSGGLGTINVATDYYINGTAGASSGGSIAPALITVVGGIVTAITAVSDERLKLWQEYEGGLKEVLGITPVKFKWNEKGQEHTGADGDREYVGFLAQDVQMEIPQAVATEKSKDGKEDYLSLDDRPIIAALVNAVKELAAKNAELESRLAKLGG